MDVRARSEGVRARWLAMRARRQTNRIQNRTPSVAIGAGGRGSLAPTRAREGAGLPRRACVQRGKSVEERRRAERTNATSPDNPPLESEHDGRTPRRARRAGVSPKAAPVQDYINEVLTRMAAVLERSEARRA